jgi:hypothetical protein
MTARTGGTRRNLETSPIWSTTQPTVPNAVNPTARAFRQRYEHPVSYSAERGWMARESTSWSELKRDF